MTKKLSEAFFGDKKFTEVHSSNLENIPAPLQKELAIRTRRHLSLILALHFETIADKKRRRHALPPRHL
jgi:hypothetical protein